MSWEHTAVGSIFYTYRNALAQAWSEELSIQPNERDRKSAWADSDTAEKALILEIKRLQGWKDDLSADELRKWQARAEAANVKDPADARVQAYEAWLAKL